MPLRFFGFEACSFSTGSSIGVKAAVLVHMQRCMQVLLAAYQLSGKLCIECQGRQLADVTAFSESAYSAMHLPCS